MLRRLAGEFQSLSRDSGRLNQEWGTDEEGIELLVSIPQSGFGAFERKDSSPKPVPGSRFQSLSRDSGRLNCSTSTSALPKYCMFQSLSRDSGRLNDPPAHLLTIRKEVSIPQSGFGAFEPKSTNQIKGRKEVSIPQSGFGAFELCPFYQPPRVYRVVSIPQSGFGAFELIDLINALPPGPVVSIPQSGFGAFEPFWDTVHAEPNSSFQSLSRDSGRLNPPSERRAFFCPCQFQSLSRDSGRLNLTTLHCLAVRNGSFNPSVGIRGV